MKLPKLSVTVALVTFTFNVLVAPIYAVKEPPYKTSVGGGAYCECRKATHLAATLLLAGVLIGAIVALAIKKPSDPNGTHGHTH